MTETNCARCGDERAKLDRPPFPDELGARIQAEICRVCWDEWLTRQMQLINHYALDVRSAEARDFLRRNVEAFLFGSGDADEIDTSQEGKISG
ncbi:MAG: oxidative damage protection protein [Gemmatimonadales bacterium]|jgi:Fe-S cluster biosynthesis and repair protein YggX